MLWDSKLIAKLLQKYKENRILWDPTHPNYTNKPMKQVALQNIKEELDIPLSTADIHRKYKSMRAAYQVEVRKINAAKIRGFYYKPTLHWFDHFHRFYEEMSKIKEQLKMEGLRQREKYMRVNEDGTIGSKKKRKPIVALNRPPISLVEIMENDSTDPSDVENSAEESDDEFQTFADHIAEQLRSISTHRAVMIQNQIQRLFARDRDLYGDDAEHFMLS